MWVWKEEEKKHSGETGRYYIDFGEAAGVFFLLRLKHNWISSFDLCFSENISVLKNATIKDFRTVKPCKSLVNPLLQLQKNVMVYFGWNTIYFDGFTVICNIVKIYKALKLFLFFGKVGAYSFETVCCFFCPCDSKLKIVHYLSFYLPFCYWE